MTRASGDPLLPGVRRRHGRERCVNCALRHERRWRAEAGGLALMLASIHDSYELAVTGLGGDSEILRSQIFGARRYLTMVFDDKWEATR